MSKSRTKYSATPVNNIKRICRDLGELFEVLDDNTQITQHEKSEAEYREKRLQAFSQIKQQLAELS
ncbi:MAG: hypothetical protein R2827_15165 [Bdellovibrionales bacterium]